MRVGVRNPFLGVLSRSLRRRGYDLGKVADGIDDGRVRGQIRDVRGYR